MLSKDKRLNLKTEFKSVVRGKRVETPNFKLYFIIQDKSIPRVGISLSKKNFNKATLRNRARRLASVAIERIYGDLPEGLKLIIMPKGQILESNNLDLTEEILKAISK